MATLKEFLKGNSNQNKKLEWRLGKIICLFKICHKECDNFNIPLKFLHNFFNGKFINLSLGAACITAV